MGIEQRFQFSLAGELAFETLLSTGFAEIRLLLSLRAFSSVKGAVSTEGDRRDPHGVNVRFFYWATISSYAMLSFAVRISSFDRKVSVILWRDS